MFTKKSGIQSGLTLCRFLIAIVLPKPIARPLLALESKYNLLPWQPSIGLHITLVSPFSTEETIEKMTTRLTPVAIKTKPFAVKVKGFGRFDNAASIFYAQVVSSASLTKLADNAMAAVADLRPPRSYPKFTPHITLAAPANRTTIDQYFTKSTSDAPHLSFTCHHFSLLLLDKQIQQWNIISNFNFTL